jgi:UDP-GlcNAc3NAcA epimerase
MRRRWDEPFDANGSLPSLARAARRIQYCLRTNVSKRVLTVVGARPQFIKASAVSREIAHRIDIEETLVHTGQHYDANMSDRFFEELAIPAPTMHLGIGSGSHGQQTGRMLEALETAMQEVEPDWVVVYGDTNSTLAGALAAAKLHVPVAHVEAGLRSFNRRMPEELNRVATDHLSDLLLAPTEEAVANLAREGIDGHRVARVGDVMYDVALLTAERARERSQLLAALGLEPRGYVVATVHRAENTDDPKKLSAIMEALGTVAARVPVVLPVHPRTRNRLASSGIRVPSGVRTVDPLGYLDMTALVCRARLVVTDSGGLQKEAFFHGVPCVTVRGETEWVELVSLGWNRLVPPESGEAVVAAVEAALEESTPAYCECAPYGDGNAAAKIVDLLAKGKGR